MINSIVHMSTCGVNYFCLMYYYKLHFGGKLGFLGGGGESQGFPLLNETLVQIKGFANYVYTVCVTL